jgi:hypothetical protein
MTRATTAKALATAAVAATAGLAAAPASAASTTATRAQGFVPRASSANTEPQTAQERLILKSVGGCQTSSAGGLRACAHITGHGNHVSSVSMYQVCVLGAGMWVRDYIFGPSGIGSWLGSREFYRSHGNCIPNVKFKINASRPGWWVFQVREFSATGYVIPIWISLHVV